ncbi:Dendritic cell-specific transmembrane protein [Tinamus guttatus]|uniref:Dendritic cell-specific transmembrane protein n=1 Tax=Tinamus guttatus TaxID=94827 RepID=A0A099ZPH3_TINGU|nr:PREDICTED: dendritic cell-specific transmembrane protein [Tinamus guttatus]KGL83731.1 Dendritic cell-specific transmembrane protein [Tinamus guttatus]
MRTFVSIAQSAWGIFISERKPGWKYLMQLFAVCSAVGFLSSVLFFLGIKFSLAHWPLDPLLISGFTWITFSAALCSSKHLRCFSILFILSCGLREGRNALIAAGTGVVVAGHIQSVFRNLKVLADSITCHLEVEQFTLIKHYIEAIKWIFQMAKFSTELSKDIVSLSHEFTPSYSISDDTLKQELNNTKQEIQKVANQISFMLTVLPCIGKRVLPIIGIFLVPLGTGLFIKKFVGSHTAKFKNTYITKQFVAFDEHQRQQQKPCVLPLNRSERKDYVTIPSFSLTWKDRKNMRRFLLPVIIHLCIWFLFAAIDYLLYWLIISVNNHLQELPDQEIGLILFQQNNFIIGDRKLIVKNDTFKISLFKHDCIPKPELYLSATWIQLGIIVFFLIILGLFSGVLTQFKILVSTSFYPDTEMKRVCYLHAKLLKKRAKLQQKTVQKNAFARTVNFWFPILKATVAVRKKERNVINDNTV